MLTNTKWRVFAFNRTTGAPVLGNAANITAKLAIDFGVPAAVAGASGHPVEAEDGYYYFDLTTGERTGQFFELFPESSTSNVQVVGVPGYLSAVSSGGASGGRGGTYRRTTDLSPVLFTFPTGALADAAFTKTLRIDGGSPANVTGTISYLYQIGGKHWYKLNYNAADRPASGADGVVQYVITDGTDTVVVGLVVGGAAIAQKAALIGTDEMFPPNAILQPSNMFVLNRIQASGVQYDVLAFVGESHLISIPSADYSAVELQVVFQSINNDRDVAVIQNGAITKTSNFVSFAMPSKVRAKPQKLRYAVRRVSNGEVLLHGTWEVNVAAKESS